MAKKTFLLGFGLGLMIATFILQFDFWQSGKQAATETLTIEQLRQQAEKAGYQLKTENELKLEIEKAVQNSKSGTSDAQTDSDDKQSGVSADTTDSEKPTDPPATTNRNDNGSQSGSNTTANASKRTVTIQYGWDATTIANYLYREGVVKDKQKLINVLIGMEKTRKISTGSFTFELNSDANQIANAITRLNR